MELQLDVVIAGGGVAGLEAAFALRALAGERVSVTVLSAEPDFVYRPLAIGEPFTHVPAEHHRLDAVVAAAGAEHISDSFRWPDSTGRVVYTREGRQLPYDALLLALGARSLAPFRDAVTFDFHRPHAQLADLLGEIASGSVRRVVAVIPSRAGWPLPLYEMCLLLARGARDRGVALELTLATPEESPLAWFGASTSRAVAELLASSGVRLIAGVNSEVPEPGVVSLRPGLAELTADRVIAMPYLYGPSTPGVPKRARGGFISVDHHCQVPRLLGVFAAGDATDFPVKFGAVAGQQADSAASVIAANAGAPVQPVPFHPVINGVLLGGERPLHMRAHLMGGHCHLSEVDETPRGGHATPLAAPYLADYLDVRTAAPAS